MLGDAKLVGERWVLKHHVGAGSFAVVWKAQHRVTGEVVAIKEIKEVTNKKLMQARACAGPAPPRAPAGVPDPRGCGAQSLAGEISILKQITHKNIVQLLEVVEARPRAPPPRSLRSTAVRRGLAGSARTV